MKLLGRAKEYWYNIEILLLRRDKLVIIDWEDVKEKLKEKYLPKILSR
jgi:hypothetical protein